ncbi:MAG: acyl-CoA thioesterase [Comamonas sp.]
MKILLPEKKRWVRDARMDVRWGDMDSLGHVNNAMYFRYMESIRVEWLRADRDTPHEGRQGPVVANCFCNYLRQIEYPAKLIVKMYVSDAARTAFETWYEIEQEGEPGVVYANGGATVIWVDFDQQKAVNLPDWMRQMVEGEA